MALEESLKTYLLRGKQLSKHQHLEIACIGKRCVLLLET